MNNIFCNSEPKSKHSKRNEEDDRYKRERVVFEDRFEAEHDTRLGTVHFTNSTRPR